MPLKTHQQCEKSISDSIFVLVIMCLQKFPSIFLRFIRTLLKCIIFINSLKALGSRFFTSDGAIDIGMGCEVWRGYYQSARQGWKRVLLNINMASSVFLRGMPVLEYLYEITRFDARVNEDVLPDKSRMKFTGEIKSMLQSAYFERYVKTSSSFFVKLQMASFESFKKSGLLDLNYVVVTFIILLKKTPCPLFMNRGIGLNCLKVKEPL